MIHDIHFKTFFYSWCESMIAQCAWRLLHSTSISSFSIFFYTPFFLVHAVWMQTSIKQSMVDVWMTRLVFNISIVMCRKSTYPLVLCIYMFVCFLPSQILNYQKTFSKYFFYNLASSTDRPRLDYFCLLETSSNDRQRCSVIYSDFHWKTNQM